MVDNQEDKVKKYSITDDHFGVFDNFFEESLLDSYIEHFERMESINLTHDRKFAFKEHECSDRACSLFVDSYFKDVPIPYIINPFLKVFDECYSKYLEKYSILGKESTSIIDAKIQKTIPGQGFHQWHYEHGNFFHRNRVAAFSLYLNDVEHGGETEFLYQKKRFDAVKNRLLIWPAVYTHVHRGNPPLSNEKYILTGWIEYV